MGSNIEQSYEASPLANLSKAFEGKSCTRGIPHVAQARRMTLGSRLLVNFSN